MRHPEILECRDLSLSSQAKAVLTWVAIIANPETSEAWITIQSLCEYTCLSKSSVQRGVKELEALKIITVDRASGRARKSIFWLHMETLRQLKGISQTPLKDTQDENKGISQGQKGVSQNRKGISQTPKNNINNLNTAHAHAHARKMPPRTGSTDPAAKKAKKEPAVNRGTATGGVLPTFHETTSTEAREWWRNCLQGKTSDFRIPETAILGPIEGGIAKIFNLSGFDASQITQHGRVEIVISLSRLTGDKINLVMTKEIAA